MKCGVNRMFFFGHVKYLRDEIFKRFNHISKEEYKITHSKKKKCVLAYDRNRERKFMNF